jgi:hypothetical protein
VRTAAGEAEGKLLEELLIVALTELLALVIMASASTLLWEGKVVLYLGDNHVVISWVGSRQASHPVARYLLQILTALECIHHFGVHSEYWRTYHNIIADALTRQDADTVMKSKGLRRLDVEETWKLHLSRGWQRRALIWAGQPQGDRRVALQLADRRRDFTDARDGVPGSCLGVWVSELASGHSLSNYYRAAAGHGATAMWWALFTKARACMPFLNLSPVARNVPGREEDKGALAQHLYAGTCVCSDDAKAFAQACAHGAPEFIWADFPTAKPIDELKQALTKQGYVCLALPVTGRDLGDQVWWHGTVLAARWAKEPDTPCRAIPEQGTSAKK